MCSLVIFQLYGFLLRAWQFKVPGAVRIYRSAPAAMDCHWGWQGRWTLGMSETDGGATEGATGPIVHRCNLEEPVSELSKA